MRKLLLRPAVLCCLLTFMINCRLHAQWVSIPDTSFGKWLSTHGYNSCLQGNSITGWQMDTTCPAVINSTSVSCYNIGIRNLSGIQYFDKLKNLVCRSNLLTSLPA